MKIAVLGTGSVGSLFAAHLAQDPSNEVLCVVGSESHRDRINREGITILEADGSHLHTSRLQARTDTAGETPAELVLVTVKTYNTWKAIREHPEIFGPDTLILTLQNGYGNHEDLLAITDDRHIFLGTTAHGVNIDPEGNIRHAGEGPTFIGPLDIGNPDAMDDAKTIAALLRKAGFDAAVSPDITDAVFRKLLINIAINPLSALNDSINEYVLRDAAVRNNARMLVKEALMILEMTGYSYDFEEIWEGICEVVERTSKNVCSMLADVRSGRPTEVRRINGAIVELARQQHVDAPQNRDIMHQIELQFGAE